MIKAIQEQVATLATPMRNAYIDFSAMTTSVVAVTDDRGLVGYGFGSNGRYAQRGILQSRIIPRLLAAPGKELLDDAGRVDPERAHQIMMQNEKPGGHGDRSVAIGVMDMALWDLAAKEADMPLARLLAERYATGTSSEAQAPDDSVAVYAAGGYYYPNRDLEALSDELRGYLDLGYTQVKIKIGGATLDSDKRRIEEALAVVGDGSHLAVDANGRFGMDTSLQWGAGLAEYRLRWYEEPGDPLDYEIMRALAEVYDGPLATGENLFSTQEALNLLRYGGLRPQRDLLQVDPSLSYGVPEYVRTLRAMEDYGWSTRACIPHGGHQFNLAVAAGLHLGGCEAYPSVFAPFGGFADATPIREGKVGLPDLPGIGIEGKSELFKLIHTLF